MILGFAFVYTETFEDEADGLIRRQVIEVRITGETMETFAFDTPEPGEHDLADFACLVTRPKTAFYSKPHHSFLS
jgi:hypothetical protein